MTTKPTLTWQTALAPALVEQFETLLTEIATSQADLQAKIDCLTAQGCLHANLVEEWRNNRQNGPYWRLTFYMDETGHTPKRRYIKVHEVEETRTKLENYKTRVNLIERKEVLDQYHVHFQQTMQHILTLLTKELRILEGK